eukprot:3890094-Karenia_brevis.AAC.1
MAAAEEADQPCLSTTVVKTADKNACTKLYNILLMVCKEKALNKVVNAGQNEGLEAWRQLCLLFEPRIRARYAGLLAE